MEVNISARQIDHAGLVPAVRRVLAETGLSGSDLTLEITESALMHDSAAARRVLFELKELGVTLAIDDFGTGYSSLSRLQRFSVDSLKIDRAFICNMDTDPESREMVRLIIMLAHNLGLKVVAEGAETEEHVKQLQQLGCEMAQGYFFSRPADPHAMSTLLGYFRREAPALQTSPSS